MASRERRSKRGRLVAEFAVLVALMIDVVRAWE
jgi:hypothetical protein